MLSAGVTSLAPSRDASPDQDQDDGHLETTTPNHTAGSRSDTEPSSLLTTTPNLPPTISKLAIINYLKNWHIECAPFLDKFDTKQHFGIQVPILAQKSPALLYAVLAFSARQTERKRAGLEKRSYDSLELYQESIRLLSSSLQARDPNVTLATVCILACLELMSGSPKDWKRHLEGCASLFDCYGVTGFSGGLLQAVFWCYARMELCGVIISNCVETTVLPLEQWAPFMPPDYHSPAHPIYSRRERWESFAGNLFRERSRNNPDMHANWAVYLCTRACDLVRRRILRLERGEVDPDDDDDHNDPQRAWTEQWHRLWAELHFWVDNRPPELLPVATAATTPPARPSNNGTIDSSTSLFPRVLYTHWAAISSNQLYHTACLVLLDTRSLARPDLTTLSSSSPTTSIHHHAKSIISISLTNPHSGNLVNAIQPLYLAGRHLSHIEEHIVVGRLLKKIDRGTGWGALWRLRDLEREWGYEGGEILEAL